MQKWEYKVLWFSTHPAPETESMLNDLGAHGWELVAVEGYSYIFKRAKS